MATTVADAWLGTGLSSPMRPEKMTGRRASIVGMGPVLQPIEMILDTEGWERITLSDFGCFLRRYPMESNPLTTRSAMEGLNAKFRADLDIAFGAAYEDGLGTVQSEDGRPEWCMTITAPTTTIVDPFGLIQGMLLAADLADGVVEALTKVEP